ncbi:hypothetical protein [Nocardioides sp. Kera G14]|uniref:hypothetical protein n=1 Tax=Nocardioides sp. Kera G14 TaxID=2884264 RepID=UPI001D0FAE77|nr:hypothetical protein [Nocardioides sp. Kera G14]UDY23595.1 hypothetical protein LH076_16275 [Nocardioides sp. Kera G14]
MKLYADTPARRAAQVLGDVAAVLFVLVSVLLARKVHEATLRLATPGRRIEAAGDDLAARLRDAGARLSDVPLVGDAAGKPFDGASGAASGLADAGRAQVHAATTLADWLGVAVALIPVVLLLVFYLPPRLRFVRRASAGQRFLDSGADLDLFALRALTHQPLHVLARITDDPAGAWRRRDGVVLNRLAALELRSVGLQPPRTARQVSGRE